VKDQRLKKDTGGNWSIGYGRMGLMCLENVQLNADGLLNCIHDRMSCRVNVDCHVVIDVIGGPQSVKIHADVRGYNTGQSGMWMPAAVLGLKIWQCIM
jgi:hypothetical protein